MSPSRRGDSGGARTAEERERDRLERERRRARQRGAATSLGGEGRAEPLFDPAETGFEEPPPAAREEVWSGPPGLAYPTGDPVRPAHPGDPASPVLGDRPAAYDQPEAYDPPADSPPPAQAWAQTGVRPTQGQPKAEADSEVLPGGARPRRSPGAQDGPATGIPAALGRAAAALSGAGAALSGAAAAARARVPEALVRGSGPQAKPGLGPWRGAGRRAEAEDRAEPDADSLRTPLRPRPTRRTPGRAGIRPRPRPRSRTTPVSKTKRSLSAPSAPSSRRGRIAAGVALAAVVLALWFLFSLFQPFKGSGQGTVAVDIPAGASSSTIATLLADRGVISSGFFFKLRTTLAGKRGQLESGHFGLRRDMSYGAALDVLTSGHQGGKAAQIRVTIPEGLSRVEIAAVAKRAGVTGDYVRASLHSHVLTPSAYGAHSAHSLEGFLFPSTYDLLPSDPASKLVNAQLSAFRSNLARVDLSRARSKRLSIYDVLTIASMVEREAQRSSERPLVAAVIYNRLHSGMPLGIDATIRYAINDYSRPLTASDLRLPSPYNTRLHQGLPPTPIGNPGLASIEAAAHPGAVPYLYYVVKPGACGEHAFSTTFAQFQQDVARYNNARTAKGGKSPSSCAR